MHITVRNVNEAFRRLVTLFSIDPDSPSREFRQVRIERRPSRNGDVLVIDEPVIITYTNPTERVLFNSVRDTNPFFHVYEALWMLAGRNDVAPLKYFVSTIDRFSDDSRTFNGAYGYRWRKAKGSRYIVRTYHDANGTNNLFDNHYDQLDILVNHLKADPNSRRAVLQMWNMECDLLKVGGLPVRPDRSLGTPIQERIGDIMPQVTTASKDVCCNLSVHFMVETGICDNCKGKGVLQDHGPSHSFSYECSKCHGHPHEQPRYLNMTVFNRSNDLIWGTLGANVVHFSVLQEYMAARLGVKVGVYNQVSNNLHVYTAPERWNPKEWLKEYAPRNLCQSCHPHWQERGYWGRADCCDGCGATGPAGLYVQTLKWYDPYEPLGFDVRTDQPAVPTIRLNLTKGIKPYPLVKDPGAFERELPVFVDLHAAPEEQPTVKHSIFTEPFLANVASPMMRAFQAHRLQKDPEAALVWANRIEAEDWRIAATQWLSRRAGKKQDTQKEVT